MYFSFPLMQCRLSACYNKMEWTLLEAYADIATGAEENMHAAGASHADCPTVALAAGFRGPMLFWCRVDGGGVALPHLMFLPLSDYMTVSSHSAVKVRPFSPASHWWTAGACYRLSLRNFTKAPTIPYGADKANRKGVPEGSQTRGRPARRPVGRTPNAYACPDEPSTAQIL